MTSIGPDPRRPRLVVAGAHLSGQPLNGELLAVGATLVEQTTTATAYRLMALPIEPVKPALVRVAAGGTAIAVEVWELSAEGLGRFLTPLPAPMAIARIELADGTIALGFTCEAHALSGATDISAYGGWPAYRAARSAPPAAAPPRPAAGPSGLPGPSGLTWHSGLNSALDNKLGLELLEVTPARVVGRMPVAGNTQPFGVWHGGASCVLAESLASLGSLAHGRPDRHPVGVDINATHHRSVDQGWVTATATALQLGRSMTSYDVVLRDDRDRRICTARVTCRLLGSAAGEPAPESASVPS